MQFALQFCGFLVGIPLELLLIAALLRGGYKLFPFVFAYAVADFLTSAIEMSLWFGYYSRWSPYAGDAHLAHKLVFLYWLDETVLQFLVFAVVMSLVWEATAAAASKRTMRASLIGFVILFAGISFLVQFDPNPKVPIGVWMTPWARDLNFGSAILDLALWAMLLASRRRDPRVLMLSGGLGIEFTGEAIGESLRHFGNHPDSLVALAGSILVMVTNLLFLYVWWQAFRSPRAGKASAA